MSKLYACGKNDYYQYGSNQTASNEAVLVNVSKNALNGKVIKEITCGIYYGFVITSDNESYGFGNNPNYNLGFNNPTVNVLPTKIDTVADGNWKYVFANTNTNDTGTKSYFSFFIKTEYTSDILYAAGDNTMYNLCLGSFSDPGRTKTIISRCSVKLSNKFKGITFNMFYTFLLTDVLYWCGGGIETTEHLSKEIVLP
jgi:alpha-tubulin suppressor-like RCC1 family protein